MYHPPHSPSRTARASRSKYRGVSLLGDDRQGCNSLSKSPITKDKEALAQTCPFCSRRLIKGKYPKWPNQYDRSRWKKVLVCPTHGPVRQIWENHDNEG